MSGTATTDAVAPDEPGSGSLLGRLGLSAWDASAIVVAALLVVVFAPPLMFDAWTPRAVLLLAIAPVGGLLLGGLVARRDRAAVLLAAALGWVVLAALLSPAPRSALVGSVGRDLSAVTVVAAAGLWALGRQMTSAGRTVLAAVHVWATAFVALIGVLQVVADVTSGPLALASGRPAGLVTNPVYFGALCASGLLATVSAWEATTCKRLIAPIVVLGVGTSLSGSRAALIAGVAILAVHVALTRTRRGVEASGLALLALGGGVALDRWIGAGRNAADRLADGAGGGRLTVWRYGIEAWLERPVAGHGLGRFRPAVQDKFSVAFVRDHAADDLTQAWFDPHNVIVGLLVGVGLVGTVLFLAWAVAWGRELRSGPLVWAIGPILVHWLLQPVSLFTLPIAMLFFAAAGRPAAPDSRPAPGRRAIGSAVLVGAVLGGGLLVADVLLRRAADEGDGGRAAAIATAFADDPVMSDIVAQIYALTPAGADSERAVLEWRRRGVDAEPDRPYWWTRLALAQIDVGQFDAAETSVGRALDLQPNNVRALRVLGRLAIESGDEAELDVVLEQLCALGQPECDSTAAELLAVFEESRP